MIFFYPSRKPATFYEAQVRLDVHDKDLEWVRATAFLWYFSGYMLRNKVIVEIMPGKQMALLANKERDVRAMIFMEYRNKNLDELFISFMKLFSDAHKNGIASLKADTQKLEEPVAAFLTLSVEFVIDGQPPEIIKLLLAAERQRIMLTGELKPDRGVELLLIEECILAFQRFDIKHFLDYGNLWGNAANEYAWKVFFPELSVELQKEAGVKEMLDTINVYKENLVGIGILFEPSLAGIIDENEETSK